MAPSDTSLRFSTGYTTNPELYTCSLTEAEKILTSWDTINDGNIHLLSMLTSWVPILNFRKVTIVISPENSSSFSGLNRLNDFNKLCMAFFRHISVCKQRLLKVEEYPTTGLRIGD